MFWCQLAPGEVQVEELCQLVVAVIIFVLLAYAYKTAYSVDDFVVVQVDFWQFQFEQLVVKPYRLYQAEGRLLADADQVCQV